MVTAANVRGIRNNNPLNIIKGISWKGLLSSQTDPRFCQFESMAYGVRAAIILLRNYITGRNSARVRFDTPKKIIYRWAPPSENQSSLYLQHVCKETGLDPDAQLSWPDKEVTFSLLNAMCLVEVAQSLNRDTFECAWAML